MRPNNIAKQHTILQSIPAFVKRSGGLFIISSRMQSRTIIVYPILGIPWRFFQTFAIKKFGPAGKLPCGTLIRRKKKRTGNHIHPAAEKLGENCPTDIRRRFPKFLPYITRRHLLLNGSSGIVWACLPYPRRTSLPLRGKGSAKPRGCPLCSRQGRSHSRTARLLPALPRGKDFPSPQRKTGRLPVFLHNSLTKAVSRMHKTKKELQKALQTVHLYRPAPESRGSRLTGRSLLMNAPVPSG